MMASRVVRFNSYLLLALVASCAVGCKSMKKKDATTFRLHQEVNRTAETGAVRCLFIARAQCM